MLSTRHVIGPRRLYVMPHSQHWQLSFCDNYAYARNSTKPLLIPPLLTIAIAI